MTGTKINVMEMGDLVLSVSRSCISLQKANGEVEIFPIAVGDDGHITVEKDGVVTIGFGDGTAETITKDGMKCTTF